MKTNFLAAALSIISFGALAQTASPAQPSTKLESMSKIELGLHGLGLAYEVPLSARWSANLSAGLGGGYAIEQNDFENGFNSTWIINEPVAYFRSEFKYTYNRDRRLSKSKSILNNAGNYVAFQVKYTTNRVFEGNDYSFLEEPLNRTLLNEAHWGMQRPLGQKFIFNLHLGLGYATDFDFDNSQLYPAAGVQFSYVISKRAAL
ncbi:hypothetical protein [Pontibacter actiniarum]|uniref:Outer membrane protein beta-barrel domain-containing protein n=1 Tax=Pontibacter actiniarum TaxID=323450 RepID=A0A1X9YN42_9BACT|nr:hypothetical protein [Pontibacter actiniarum]ARS34241.1 hypothetical protein CA264_01625 [Pontibacter actiniarum]